MVQSRQWGGMDNFIKYPPIAKLMSAHPDQSLISFAVVEGLLMTYSEDFLQIQQMFKENQIDLALCDSFATACLDAAIVSNIPVVLTSTLGLTSDFVTPYVNNKYYNTVELTNERESVWFRIYRDFFRIPYGLYKVAKKTRHALQFQKQVLNLPPAIDASHKRYENTTKLINNVFGLELARPHSPLFHMVGPIISRQYPALDNVTATFLNSHSRVAYVAFGQHAVPSDNDLALILSSLLRLKAEGYIDGILWARLDPLQIPTAVRLAGSSLPYSNITVDPDFLISAWAPQFAILQHSSTSFFLTHGGIGSMHEGLYSGKRLFVFPFFGDQPMNARAVERTNLGRFMDMFDIVYDKATYEEFYRRIKEVAADPEHRIQKTVDQYKTHLQIRASHAVLQSADLLEECIFASDEYGNLPYRRDAAYDMSWIKRYNLDVYTVVLVCAAVFTWLAVVTVLPMTIRLLLQLHSIVTMEKQEANTKLKSL
ncbi:hypothetical protein BDF20DRAFT_812435 [Mycotypha africana]|uniref:uncharacterized protein n=1 Tax=Mycotypha africana TaxID=64632 RepID=UPI0023003FFE|nr:uncharacterized protein BDF20DRAFT_812435 [Mycotypha africana]KAI8991143.1 hypothetical protein BDF20DRAFT_812435 [Mycotypha africana]